jgi:hypothetical protein
LKYIISRFFYEYQRGKKLIIGDFNAGLQRSLHINSPRKLGMAPRGMTQRDTRRSATARDNRK